MALDYKRKKRRCDDNDEVFSEANKSSLLNYFDKRSRYRTKHSNTNTYSKMPSKTLCSSSSFSASTPSTDVSSSSSKCTRSFDSSTPSTCSSSAEENGVVDHSLSHVKKTVSSDVLASRKNKSVSRKKKSSQLYLDFGQVNFGKRTICKICNQLYVNGHPEDEANHEKMCMEYQSGVTFAGWKNERVVSRTDTQNGDRIVEIRACDSSKWLKKVEQVKKIVDEEMGFVQDEKASVLEGSDRAYLLIRQKKVVGFCIVQIIKGAYELRDKMGRGNIRSKEETKALMGVYQIWVHRNFRRSRYASKIIDTARTKLAFGTVIPLQMVAFSSPTQSGAAFAKAYTKMLRPKVYDC